MENVITMFGLFGFVSKARKFDEVSHNLLNKYLMEVATNHEIEIARIFEHKEKVSLLMNAQIYAIAASGCKEKERLALLSSFARHSEEHDEKLQSFLKYSANMNSPSAEENRNYMWHHIGTWTIEQTFLQSGNLFEDFSDEFIMDLGEAIYNAALVAGVQSKLIK